MKKQLKPKRTGKNLIQTDDERMHELSKEGYTLQEIADAYDISRTNVHMRIKRVKQKETLKEKARGKIYEFIDMGKVFALKRAGWTNKKIGEEFHKTAEEMKRIISEWQQDTGMEELCQEA